MNPNEYLKPENFVSPLDSWSNQEYKTEQYLKGLEIGRTSDSISIARNGVWSATSRRGHVQSYERIGYHAHTSELLRGFLDSGCSIYVYSEKGKAKIK